MVLSMLAVSIRGLIRRIQLETLTYSHNRQNPSSDSEATALAASLMDEHDRGVVVSPLILVPAEVVNVGVASIAADRGSTGGERGFMTAARGMVPATATTQPTVMSRTACSKRKLEELEIGVAEWSSSANSQVRARREAAAQQAQARDEVMEGQSIAESSGRERYDEGSMGLCASSGEAQALDGESDKREEGGNEAVDADAMWEEEAGWNSKTLGEQGSSTNKVLADDTRAEDIVSGSTEGTVSAATSLVGVTSGPVPPPSFLGDSPVVSDAGGTGRSGTTEEELAAGKDGELSKESEADALRSQRERESSRESSVFVVGVDEESSIRRYSSIHPAALEGVGSGSVSGYVSSFAVAAGVNSTTSGGNGGEATSSLSDSRLQFFVRTYIDGRTVVLQATSSDTIESVHQQIYRKTGLPVSEQRLLFGGRQLQHEQTLESCNVVNDATLNLVARMRSTALPRSWQLINDLVATIRRMCAVPVKLVQYQDTVRASVQEFLKMPSKSVPVSEHMQVFQLAGATSALVMLLLSPIESNRECAEESISHFLQANEEYFPAQIHCHCASVILDFCKLLSKSAPHHSLYASCRNTLARLLDTVGIAHGSPYFHEAKADSIVQDFSPFVNELSVRLCSNLQSTSKALTMKEATNFASYVKEAKDFTAFVIPLCKAMEVCKGSTPNSGRCNDCAAPRYSTIGDVVAPEFLGAFPLRCDGPPLARNQGTASPPPGAGVEIGTHDWLRALFLDLLEEVHNCLNVLEEEAQKPSGGPATITDDRERPLGWAPFLIVLKGLHAIAKLYVGAMDSFLDVLSRRSVALNMLIRQSRWQDDDFWVLEYKSLLDFDSKRKLVMAMLPEPQDDHDERQEIIVHRAHLLTESFESLAYVEPDGLQGGISVEFSTEEATGPGVLREWFSMICREIFNCQNALFLPCPKDRRRFFPNPASGVNPGHLTYFRFCGRVIALALMHKVQVDVVFALTFFKQLAGLPISWEDAKDADPVLYESCKKILEMDPDMIDSDALGLTFVSEVEELGTRKTLELCQGGREMVVNSENRRQFVELLVHRRLVASVAEQIKSFSQGFSDLLMNATHQQFLRALEPGDLDLLLYGKDRNICLDDWKAHTEYHDYTATDNQIIWFWQVVESMTPEQRRRLLFFSTSVTHLPAEGFTGLSSKFHIHRAHTDTSWLPTAHTCFYQLVLPAYPTYEMMQTRLQAIAETHIAEGFGFA